MLENENATHPCAQSSHPGTNRQGCDLTDSKERGKLSGPGFSLHFWLVKKFESRYPMKWMDFFHFATSHDKLLGNRETPKMQRLCHRNTITDNCASSLKPAASPRTSSGLPELIFISSLFLVVSIFCMMLLPLAFIVFLYQPLGKHVSSAPIKHPQLRFKEPHCWDFWIPPVVFLFAHSPCSIGERRRSRVKARFCWTGWTYARYLKWSKLWDLRIQNDNYRITFNGH